MATQPPIKLKIGDNTICPNCFRPNQRIASVVHGCSRCIARFKKDKAYLSDDEMEEMKAEMQQLVANGQVQCINRAAAEHIGFQFIVPIPDKPAPTEHLNPPACGSSIPCAICESKVCSSSPAYDLSYIIRPRIKDIPRCQKHGVLMRGGPQGYSCYKCEEEDLGQEDFGGPDGLEGPLSAETLEAVRQSVGQEPPEGTEVTVVMTEAAAEALAAGESEAFPGLSDEDVQEHLQKQLDKAGRDPEIAALMEETRQRIAKRGDVCPISLQKDEEEGRMSDKETQSDEIEEMKYLFFKIPLNSNRNKALGTMLIEDARVNRRGLHAHILFLLEQQLGLMPKHGYRDINSERIYKMYRLALEGSRNEPR